MKYLILITGFLIFFSSCSHSQEDGNHHGHRNHHSKEKEVSSPEKSINGEPTNFPTVGFEQIHEVLIPFSVDEVSPFFEPKGRNLLYSWWNPTILREGKEGTQCWYS